MDTTDCNNSNGLERDETYKNDNNYKCAIESNLNTNIPTSLTIINNEQFTESTVENTYNTTLHQQSTTPTTPTTNVTDSCRMKKRPSTLLVIRQFHDDNNDSSSCTTTTENNYCDEKIVVTSSNQRRPTLILGDLCIIPTENPAVNERRLSKLSLLEEKSSRNHRRESLLKRMSSLVLDTKETVVSVSDLPLTFHVKYLGHYPAKGLWGIKHTRGPVDTMVKAAKNLPSNQILPIIKVTISTKGITLTQQNTKGIKTENFFAIETISYGVQDLVYTRVFSMIVVYEEHHHNNDHHPFECHAFVCESRNAARKLTYALAAAFQDYSKRVQEQAKHDPTSPVKKKFAIDLRSPEELQEDMEAETEA